MRRQRNHQGDGLFDLLVSQYDIVALSHHPQRGSLSSREVDVAAGESTDERQLEHLRSSSVTLTERRYAQHRDPELALAFIHSLAGLVDNLAGY